jgi:hypothetical protein
MVIDVPVSADSGTLIDTPADSAYPGALSMPLNQGWTFERRVYEDDGQIYCSLLMHRTVAFIAEDDDGATSTELLHLVDYFVAGYVDNDFMAILNAPQADVDWIMGVTSSCPETNLDESYPFAQFASTKSSNGEYYVTVVMVSINHDLEAFNYFLKDQSGSTIEFGEIAMQNLTGQPMGIDASYGNKCGGSDQPACDSDLSDLSDAVDGDDGSTYVVAFYDNDRDGKLSAGDKFTVRGNHGSGANGPAEDDWSIEVSFDNTGDVIGSKRLD